MAMAASIAVFLKPRGDAGAAVRVAIPRIRSWTRAGPIELLGAAGWTGADAVAVRGNTTGAFGAGGADIN
ncbi:MAG: hypothetical protein WA673_14910, partial [Candidatus Acidiferrales bacterium]